MIERFSARTRGFDRDCQILFDFGLSDEFRQTLRTKLQLKRRIVLDRRRRNEPLFEVRSVLERGHVMAIVKRKGSGCNEISLASDRLAYVSRTRDP